MRVVHLSTSDINGGAARAAFRLHKGLRLKGVDSIMFTRDKSSSDASVIKYRYPKGMGKYAWKSRKILIESDFSKYKNSRPGGQEVFSDDRSSLKPGFMDQLPESDIYHLHWISGFTDLPSFFRDIKKPVVWTLHDMFPFTGGCHYTSDCENFKSNCHHCPQLGSTVSRDLSYRIWKRKQKFLKQFDSQLIIRTNSYWLAEEARKSNLFKDYDINTIHYGIETDEFIPLDKTACRKSLKIPTDSRVIVFGAPDINNPRKGYVFLEKALMKVGNSYPNLFLLSFGSGKMPENTGFPNLHLGHISNNYLLSIIYNCADVFVIPSLEEAFGQTALEAMSCGIPVAGFNTGGIPDMVKNGNTGYLAEKGNSGELADAIIKIFESDENMYGRIAENCRETVLNGFTLIHQAEKYIHLYSQMI